MAAVTSLDAVKRKIKSLQEQADAAEERVEKQQRDLQVERKLREQVRASITAADPRRLRVIGAPRSRA